MTTRIIAVILAAVLAVVGAVLLVGYVRSADERAFAGAELTEVFVVAEAVPVGTDAGALGESVELKAVPVAYIAPGAVTDLASLSGLVASVDLEPGEQLLASRFVRPEDLSAAGGSIAVPDGLQELSLSVDAQRVVGGTLAAGDLVGLYVSLSSDGSQASRTQLEETQVLVTAVSASGGTDGSLPAEGAVSVTLAVTADQAQRIVYALEFGSVWFSRQPEGVPPVTDGAVTRKDLAG